MQKRHMRAQEKAAIFLHFIYPLAGNRKTGQASKRNPIFLFDGRLRTPSDSLNHQLSTINYWIAGAA